MYVYTCVYDVIILYMYQYVDKRTTFTSMKALAQSKQREYRDAHEESRLGKEFIRLVDFLHVEALVC